MPAKDFRPKCLCLDIETARGDAHAVREIAAWRADTGRHLHLHGKFNVPQLLHGLDELAVGAAFVVGHNIARHDLPVLRALFPALRLHALPVVDTLELSPVAFPQNPYHALVKDYKLVRSDRADPLADAKLALRLWHDEYQALSELHAASPDEAACQHFLFKHWPGARGLDAFFMTLRRARAPQPAEVRELLRRLAGAKVCASALDTLLASTLDDAENYPPLAYTFAWLRVAGGNSVLPPWVRKQFPAARDFIRRLREMPCTDAGCAYCRERFDARRELQRYFGYAEFRAEPAAPGGGSLQAAIVDAAYAGRSLLAILPTGGGKSICFQLPALSRHWRSGALTIVVTPLQSLMQDQVTNLLRAGVLCGATVNGLLSMPERREALDRVRLGDAGLLYVSPEQFRNAAFVRAIAQREIAAWVLDEAHCLSRWGHDFRPDYLYVSRFIREKSAAAEAPVFCFTATAKREVVEDLRAHFRDALGRDLELFDGGHERDNLHYDVVQLARAEKFPYMHKLLQRELAAGGGAIVFGSRQKSVEEIAAFLREMGWAAAYFHGGMEPGAKKDVQQAFIAGQLQVIAATNAFGMGVDKPDVRCVIHADVPGSLENYLQEAGRAGRDRDAARCILLYEDEDVETQFGLLARSQLTRRDIAALLRSLRRYANRLGSADIVVTPGEILSIADADAPVSASAPDADTKVRSGISWLERARFLERGENETKVFPASLKVSSVAAAKVRLDKADLPPDEQSRMLDLVRILMDQPDHEGLSTDELALALGLPAVDCIRLLQALHARGVLSNDIGLTVLLRSGVADDSKTRLQRAVAVERALLDLLPELAPDAAEQSWQDAALRPLAERLQELSGASVTPDFLLTLLRSLARPFGEDAGLRRASFTLRTPRAEWLKVRLLRPWRAIREIAERRRAAAVVLLDFLLAKLPAGERGVDLRASCTLGELGEALQADTDLRGRLRDLPNAIDAALFYLHENQILILDRGKSVFRAAMHLHIHPESRRRKFTQADYAPLAQHQAEKIFQVHVMQEYARLGVQKISDALRLVLAYFTLPRLEFIRRYFAQRRELLERCTTEESWQRIVDSLQHPIQAKLVCAAPDANRLVLAGPGSGKTRVIVHRIAYLVRVLREPPDSVLALAYNRGAAWEIRRRLKELIGADAARVAVLTYHGVALRLTGTSLSGRHAPGARQSDPDFDAMLDAAIELLAQPAAANAADADEARERLLAGYRHILVDEYQDIDERQYRLISLLAGRGLADAEARLDLFAVGDDDQNIYAFRHTSNAYIRRFQDDYRAETEFLVENYRSTAHIIAAANAVIAGVAERMKGEHPIRINHARAKAPPGGRWQGLDGQGQGRVQRLQVPADLRGQALAVMGELQRLAQLDPEWRWSGVALIGRTRATLEPLCAWCELNGLDYRLVEREGAGLRLTDLREGWRLVHALRSKLRRLLRPGLLARWLRGWQRRERADNPWLALLAQFVAELSLAWPDTQVPAGIALDALYEFAHEARQAPAGGLMLSTAHGAKGREFEHVVVLDGGDWSGGDDERRLYYVAMTRARQTLMLCEAEVKPNPFTRALGSTPWLITQRPLLRPAPPELLWRFLALGMADVDLSYAGRQAAERPVHEALVALRQGDPLDLRQNATETLIYSQDGLAVGKLSRTARLPAGRIVRAEVQALLRRTADQSEPDYRNRLRVESWWVVLPLVVVAPE
ncbi:MAG: RecQ family ATP-dependent DNA helicase [Rhodocyclaceae bacterium]|nr:RecQ family ATP-dependent DNA helicase [Rhodocyclaceae bacterium]MBX3666983.1 RecQ family ATP-dependent DNA helicase [Rhodocyclaceae bacterium]